MTHRFMALREAAVVVHCLPIAEARVTLDDGRSFRVASTPRGLLGPCAFRRAVAAGLAVEGDVEVNLMDTGSSPSSGPAWWVERVTSVSLESTQCRELGAGLYAAHCGGAPIYAFTSTLAPDMLELAVAALPDCGVSLRVIPDPQVGLTLVALEVEVVDADRDLEQLAREVQATVMVAELEWGLHAS